MPGTSKIYSAAQIQRGQADAWWNVAEPVSPAHIIALFSDGTPDAVANPAAKHLGLMQSAVFDYSPKYDLEKADQDSSIVQVFLSEEETFIELEMKQVSYLNVLQYCMTGGLFSDASKEGMMLGQGGAVLVTPAPLAIIAPSADPAYKWHVGLLYKATPVSAIQLPLERTKTPMFKVKFQGISDLARPAGDRLGAIYRTL